MEKVTGIGNSHSSKANRAVRRVISRILRGFKKEEEFTSESICRMINNDDRRRSFSATRIGALLRERIGKDLKKTTRGWIKITRGEEVNG